jgi:hypothetical protein
MQVESYKDKCLTHLQFDFLFPDVVILFVLRTMALNSLTTKELHNDNQVVKDH